MTRTTQEAGLPRATFARLTPHPYLLSNLQPPPPPSPSPTPSSRRNNGRAPHQARPPHSTTGSLSHAHGSAVVRAGDTTAICGVRGETLLVSDIPNYRRRRLRTPAQAQAADARAEDGIRRDKDADAAELMDYDLLVPNIELATGSAPQFLPGVPPTPLAQTLSTRVFSLLHSARLVDIGELRIWRTVEGGGDDGGPAAARGQEDNDEHIHADSMDQDDTRSGSTAQQQEVVAYWVLYIDIFFISFDGNAFDVAWAALLAALRNTELPHAYWDMDREMVLCTHAEPAHPLTLHGLPVACTAVVFTESGDNSQRGGAEDGMKFWLLVDPDAAEEKLCTETISMVLDRTTAGEAENTRILAVEKVGGSCLGEDLIKEFVRVAEERWSQWAAVLRA